MPSRATQIKVRISMHIRTFFDNDNNKSTNNDNNNLRHCQEVYIGASNARRLFKRSVLSKRSPHDEPIFAEHEANVRKAPSPASPVSTSSAYSEPYSGSTYSCSTTCSSAGANEEKPRLKLEKEKKVLLRSINSARTFEGVGPLIFDQVLTHKLHTYTDIMDDDEPVYSHLVAMPPTTITSSLSKRGMQTARLVSPPGLGALACGELWYGGKYKRHTNSAPTHDNIHPDNCPCHLRKVFDTMVDGMWKGVGIARSGEGRWVVEFAGAVAEEEEWGVCCDDEGDGWCRGMVVGEEGKALPAVPWWGEDFDRIEAGPCGSVAEQLIE